MGQRPEAGERWRLQIFGGGTFLAENFRVPGEVPFPARRPVTDVP